VIVNAIQGDGTKPLREGIVRQCPVRCKLWQTQPFSR
jgi:hypothetical protein